MGWVRSLGIFWHALLYSNPLEASPEYEGFTRSRAGQ